MLFWGLKQLGFDLDSKSFAASLKVTALKAIVHPVDSSEKSFKTATKLALLAAFDEMELINI